MSTLLDPLLAPMEQMVLRNVLDGERLRGVTLANQDEHDQAVIRMLKRGLIQHNPKRPRQRFSLTFMGRSELVRAEKHAAATPINGALLS